MAFHYIVFTCSARRVSQRERVQRVYTFWNAVWVLSFWPLKTLRPHSSILKWHLYWTEAIVRTYSTIDRFISYRNVSHFFFFTFERASLASRCHTFQMHRQSIAICYGFYCAFVASSITTFLFTCNWVPAQNLTTYNTNRGNTIDQLTKFQFFHIRLAVRLSRLELYHLYMAMATAFT